MCVCACVCGYRIVDIIESMARVHSKAEAHLPAVYSVPMYMSEWVCVCVLTCHTYNALVVNGTAREPGIGGAASQLGIVVLRSYLQREYARRDVGILQRKHNNDLLQLAAELPE